MSAFGRVGVSALEGRCLQRPGSRKRLPSKDFDQDDDSVQRKRRIPRTIKSTGEGRMAEPVDNPIQSHHFFAIFATFCSNSLLFLIVRGPNWIWRLHLKLLFWPATVLGPK